MFAAKHIYTAGQGVRTFSKAGKTQILVFRETIETINNRWKLRNYFTNNFGENILQIIRIWG